MEVVETVDLLVVGGGINGAGIARDAAGRGVKVMLVEQGDLAGFTSSSSTKLIHGGLRYLEYYEFRLVREALIERERLLGMAPHIIWPLRFVLPHAKGLRPAWLVRLGLFLYDHLGGRKKLPGSHGVRFRNSKLGSALRGDIEKGFVYSDCWVEDSRLVVLNAMDAAARGAEILTRTRFVTARREGRVWRAEIEGPNGERRQVAAKAIVNAGGPWVGRLLHDQLGGNSSKNVRLIKGSHIVVPRVYEGDHAYILQNPDRRIVFAIPYETDFTLIGTTDVPYEAEPGKVQISAEETSYLCESISRYFDKPVAPRDVVWSYAGVRPLYDDAAANASAVTRDYVLDVEGGGDQAPLLSVFGGKITTYRRLAEHALEKLEPLFKQAGIASTARAWTDGAILPGGDLPDADFDRFFQGFAARHPFLPERLARRLAHAYGSRAETILKGAESLADLGEDFGGSLTRAEVDYLVVNEWARTAEDILWRRSKLGLHVPEGTSERLDAYLATSTTEKAAAEKASAA